MKRIFLGALVAAAALTGSACASTGNDGMSEQMGGTVPGAAADPAEATRELVVEASDDLRFDPSTLQVGTGDVVTFVVRNTGKTDHEFVLGDEAYQEMHKADMEGGGEMMEMGNAVTVGPGESKQLTWRFDDSGEVLYGCHEPGHYEGGMVGSIEVTS